MEYTRSERIGLVDAHLRTDRGMALSAVLGPYRWSVVVGVREETAVVALQNAQYRPEGSLGRSGKDMGWIYASEHEVGEKAAHEDNTNHIVGVGPTWG